MSTERIPVPKDCRAQKTAQRLEISYPIFAGDHHISIGIVILDILIFAGLWMGDVSLEKISSWDTIGQACLIVMVLVFPYSLFKTILGLTVKRIIVVTRDKIIVQASIFGLKKRFFALKQIESFSWRVEWSIDEAYHAVDVKRNDGKKEVLVRDLKDITMSKWVIQEVEEFLEQHKENK